MSDPIVDDIEVLPGGEIFADASDFIKAILAASGKWQRRSTHKVVSFASQPASTQNFPAKLR